MGIGMWTLISSFVITASDNELDEAYLVDFLGYLQSACCIHRRYYMAERRYSNFTNMSCKALFLYIMSMCDENIINLSASYIENILNCYASEL